MVMPTYNAISYISKEAHQAALYDACLLIVNTYKQTELLDGHKSGLMTSYDFMKFALHIVNHIASEFDN
jgi:hypothetical protein